MNPVVVTLSGDIDLACRETTTATLAEAVEAACRAGVDVVVDLSEVTFLDSTGMSCIIVATRALGPSQTLHLRDPRPAARQVLEIAGLDKLIRDEPAR